VVATVSAGLVDHAIQLVRNGEDINEVGYECRAALHAAVGSVYVRQKAEAVRALIENGANVNLGNVTGATALHHAANNGNYDVMRVLLEKGANPNAMANGHDTPLVLAASMGRDEGINILLDHGADVDLHERYTLHKRLVTTLIRLFTEWDPKTFDDAYRPPLQIALRNGHLEAAQLLVRRGADVNIRSGQGNTALIWSIKLGSHGRMNSCENEDEILGMVNLLIENKAEIDVKNIHDETPLQLAEARKCRNVVELLKKKGKMSHE
jgi:ankyrin repeat protein